MGNSSTEAFMRRIAITLIVLAFVAGAFGCSGSRSGGQTGTATIPIAFQPAAAGAGPFVSFCDPSFGSATGGTALAIHGGRFCGTRGCTGTEVNTTRVVFVVNGVAREAT